MVTASGTASLLKGPTRTLTATAIGTATLARGVQKRLTAFVSTVIQLVASLIGGTPSSQGTVSISAVLRDALTLTNTSRDSLAISAGLVVIGSVSTSHAGYGSLAISSSGVGSLVISDRVN